MTHEPATLAARLETLGRYAQACVADGNAQTRQYVDAETLAALVAVAVAAPNATRWIGMIDHDSPEALRDRDSFVETLAGLATALNVRAS